MKKKVLILLFILTFSVFSKVDAGNLVIQSEHKIPLITSCEAPAYTLRPYINDQYFVNGGNYCDSMIIDKNGKILKDKLGKINDFFEYSDGKYLTYKKSSTDITLNLYKNDLLYKTIVLSTGIKNIYDVYYSLDEKDNLYIYMYYRNTNSEYKYNIYVYDNELNNINFIDIVDKPSSIAFISVINDIIYLGGQNYNSSTRTTYPVIYAYDKSFKKIMEIKDENEDVKNRYMIGIIKENDNSFIIPYSYIDGYDDTIIKKYDKNYKIVWTTVIPNEKPSSLWYTTDRYNIYLKKSSKDTYYYYANNLVELDENGIIINEYLDAGIGKNFYPYKNGVIYSYFDGGSNLIVDYISAKSKIQLNKSNVGGYRINRKNPRLGEKIQITLQIPKKYELDKIQVKGEKEIPLQKENDKVYTFIMPDEDVEISVNYKKVK